MLRITAPERGSVRFGSVRFVDGVAEVALLTKAEQYAMATRGYRIEEIPEPAPVDLPVPAEFD